MSDSVQHHGPQHTRLPCLSLSLGVCSNSRPLSWWLEVDNDQLKGSLKLILLQLHEKLQKNSASTILSSFGIWSKLERWKSSVSWCLISWAHTKKRKKIIILECRLLLFYATTTNHFSIGLWHVMKSGFYKTGDDQLSSWMEKKLQSTSQSQICTPKQGHGHCLVVCWWSAL